MIEILLILYLYHGGIMTNSQRVLDWLRDNGKGNSSIISIDLKLCVAEVTKILLMLQSMGMVQETSDLGYYHSLV